MTSIFLKRIKIKVQMTKYTELNLLGANPTKWSNTLKQFIGKFLKNCLSVFDHFVRLTLKSLSKNLYRVLIETAWLSHYRFRASTRKLSPLSSAKLTQENCAYLTAHCNSLPQVHEDLLGCTRYRQVVKKVLLWIQVCLGFLISKKIRINDTVVTSFVAVIFNQKDILYW